MPITNFLNIPIISSKGYKVLRRINGKYYPEFYSYADGEYIQLNYREKDIIDLHKWYKATHKEIEYHEIKYNTGFHIFPDLQSAKIWIDITDTLAKQNLVIAECEFRTVTTTGYQTSTRIKTLVAQEVSITKIL